MRCIPWGFLKKNKTARTFVIGAVGVLVIVGVFALIRVAQDRPISSDAYPDVSVGVTDTSFSKSPMRAERNMPMESELGGLATNDTATGGNTLPEVENREQKMIQTGKLDLRVRDAQEAVEEIRGVAEYYEGQIFSVSVQENANGMKSGYVTIKVPGDTFYRAMSGLKEIESVSIVLSEIMSGQDVTEQYVDLEARLSNKRAEESAFLELLDREEDELADVISVTRELSRVRGEIERLEGQLRYLDSKTDMSTITISISEDQTVTIVDTWRPLQEVKSAINDLLDSLQGFFSLVIVFFIWFVPMAIVYLLAFSIVFFVGRAIVRRVKRKK